MGSLRSKVRHTIGDGPIVRAQRMIGPAVSGDLGALARVYDSDKGRGHAYTPLYHRHLATLRTKRIRLLEIGIGGYESPTWGGASLRMWRDYFPYGQIHGLDIEEKRIHEPRIQVHRGDQSDEDFVRELGRQHGPFDVVVDDGSHVNAHIQASFRALFVNHVRPGGYYIIEDMSTAYLAEYGGGQPGHPGTSVALVQELVDDVNRRHWNAQPAPGGRSARPVRAVHAYEKIAFIQRD